MALILQRAGAVRIDRASLDAELTALIAWTGLAVEDTDDARAWDELSSEEVSAAEQATILERAARADNPLDLAILDRAVIPAVSAKLRNRWLIRWRREGRAEEPSIRTIRWDQLDESERSEIRRMLKELAAFYRSTIRRGRPEKSDLDATLHALAELYLIQTGSSHGCDRIPYSINSRFIQFAVLALSPFRAQFEVSEQALSRRWERFVNRERDARPDDDFIDD